jgi:hypothetical protein
MSYGVITRKGRVAFKAFLDQELPALGLSHWYVDVEMVGIYHYIGPAGRKRGFFNSLFPDTHNQWVSIEGEPDSDTPDIASDAFRMRIRNETIRPQIEKLAEKFCYAGFGIPVQIIH